VARSIEIAPKLLLLVGLPDLQSADKYTKFPDSEVFIRESCLKFLEMLALEFCDNGYRVVLWVVGIPEVE